MARADWAPHGFLVAGLIMAAAPFWYGGNVQPVAGDGALHDTYYVVAHWHVGLLPPVASIVFGLIYLAGRHLFQVEWKAALVWLHLVLWITGSTILLGPLFLVQVISQQYTVGYSVNFETLNAFTTLGYCVTLLSTAVFAICIGEAVLKRLRRGKEL